MNKLLLALLLTSNLAMADSWGEIANTHNDNIRTRAYANPPVVYVPPPVYIAPPAYIPQPIQIIQGNPNAGSYNFNNNTQVPSVQRWDFR
jgi:hypothetical protein